METYVFPEIGRRGVDHLDTPDVLRVLGPIWLTKPETARRVRQRISTVFDWAKAAGFRDGENPVSGVAKGLPKQPEMKEHHTAMPVSEVAGFISRLRASDANEITRLDLEFLVLTAARTGEVIGARWDEVDLDAAVWTIPSDRMKAKREHRVPLIPSTKVERNADGIFEPTGLERAHWTTSSPVRDIVKSAFAANGLPEYGPHGFRKTLTRLGEQLCERPEDFKAWSQNLGHEDVMTTFRSYGTLSPDRQREVIAKMRERESS